MNKNFIVFLSLLIIAVTYQYNQRNIYTVTAYCPCKICINKREYRDGKFASNKVSYWGGAAAPKRIPFGTQFRIIPLNPIDAAAIKKYLNDRRNFTVEDRGFLVEGKHFDLFIPPEMGGHQAALKWGSRQLRIVFLPTQP